jgi:hypothetical protein
LVSFRLRETATYDHVLGWAPPNDPFYVAVKFSASMNRWAAGFSGVSALLMAAHLLVGKR